MAFSTILIGTLVCYLLYYTANIVYDLFLSDTMKQSTHAANEEEIEISDADNQLQGTFYTSAIEEEATPKDRHILLEEEEHATPELTPMMNGAMSIEDLYQQVQNAQSDADLAFVSHSWNT